MPKLAQLNTAARITGIVLNSAVVGVFKRIWRLAQTLVTEKRLKTITNSILRKRNNSSLRRGVTQWRNDLFDVGDGVAEYRIPAMISEALIGVWGVDGVRGNARLCSWLGCVN